MLFMAKVREWLKQGIKTIRGNQKAIFEKDFLYGYTVVWLN